MVDPFGIGRSGNGSPVASVTIALLAGLLPILSAQGAYPLNVLVGTGVAPEFVCMPYLEGCVSITRASRGG